MPVTFFQLWVSITLASQNESTDDSFATTVIKEPSITKNIETIQLCWFCSFNVAKSCGGCSTDDKQLHHCRTQYFLGLLLIFPWQSDTQNTTMADAKGIK